MLRNTSLSYGSVAKFLHWLVFILILTLILVGFFWQDTGDSKYTVINIHKLIGLFTMLIVLVRIAWAINNTKPGYPMMARWEKIVLHATHGLIYLLLLAMPISGWVMATAAGYSPRLLGLAFPMPGIPQDMALAGLANKAHFYFAWALIALVSLHILAALKHHFINRDNVLKRMMPGQGI